MNEPYASISFGRTRVSQYPYVVSQNFGTLYAKVKFCDWNGSFFSNRQETSDDTLIVFSFGLS